MSNSSDLLSNFSIRAAMPEDLEAIAAINRECFPKNRMYYERLKDYLEESLDPIGGFSFPLAFQNAAEGQKILGFCVGYADTKHKLGEIGLLAVSEQNRRQKIGSFLFTKVFSKLYNCDLNKIILHTDPANQAAIAMYQKYGFKKDELKRNYYQSGDPALTMIYRL